MFGKGKKKTIRERLIRMIDGTDLPMIVKSDFKTALYGVDCELEGRELSEFEANEKQFNGLKDSLIQVLDGFILAKRYKGTADVSRLVAVADRLRNAKAI